MDSNQKILIELTESDREGVIADLLAVGAKVNDEMEVHRLDGLTTLQLIVEISEIIVPAVAGMLLQYLRNSRIKIKKGDTEYQGPIDRELLEKVLKE